MSSKASSNTSSNKRIAKNSIFLSIRMVIVLLISLYTTRVLLQVLGVVDYGVYNVVCGFVLMFSFLNTSMSNGIQRFFNFEFGKNGEKGANRVYCTSLYIQALLALVIVILVEFVGIWYLHNKMVIPEERINAAEWIFQYAIITFVIGIMQAPYMAAVISHERLDFYAVLSVLETLLKLGVVFLLPTIHSDKLIVYGFLIMLCHFIIATSYYIYCKKNFKEIRFHWGLDNEMFKQMLGFSGWNLFGSFSNMMRDQGINLILNFFFGPVVNAARGVAMQVNSGVTGLVTSILTPVRPQVIQSYARGEIDRVFNLTYTISKFSIYFLLVLSLPLCIELDFVLKIWLGSNIPNHTQAFIIIILLTSAVLIPMGSQATLVHASGNMRAYQVIGSLVKILSVPVAFVLMKLGYAPEWSLVMVLLFDAIGLVVGMFILSNIISFSVVEYSKKVFIPILPVAALGGLASFFVHSLFDNEILRFFVVTAASTFVMILTIYLVGMTKEEKFMIKDIVSSKISQRNRGLK